MPAALPCEFIDRARLDSKKLSDFLFGHNVLFDGINIFDGEQTGAISYRPHRHGRQRYEERVADREFLIVPFNSAHRI